MTVITNVSIVILYFILAFRLSSGSLMNICAVRSFMDSGIMVDGLTIAMFDSLGCMMDNSRLRNNNATGTNVSFLFDRCVVSESKLFWLLVRLEVEFVVFLIIMVFVAMLRTDCAAMHGSGTVAVSEARKVSSSIAIVVGMVWAISSIVWMRNIIGVRNIMRSCEGMRSTISWVVQWVRHIAVTICSTRVVVSSIKDVMFSVNEIIIITVTSFASHAVDSRNFCVTISSIERAHAMMVFIRSVLSRDMRATLPSISVGRVRDAWSWGNMRSTVVGNVAFCI